MKLNQNIFKTINDSIWKIILFAILNQENRMSHGLTHKIG